MKDAANDPRYFLTIIIFSALILFASSCQQKQKAAASPTPVPQQQAETSPSPVSTETRSYYGTGIITKIVKENPYDKSLASVELNHEEIQGLMPPMIMEFYVKEKSLIKGLKVGDKVDFTIEEKGGTEVISEIKKSKK